MSDLLERDAGTAAVAERGDVSPATGPTSDAELVRRFVRTRDEQAFVELERRFGPLVRGVCARALDRKEDREDVYQATFLTFFQRAGSIRRRSSAACWLYGVAYRIASRLRRKRRLERTELAVEPAASDQEIWIELDRKYLSEIVDAEMQALPTSDRLPLTMHYLMGLSHQEIGQSLGLSASAVDGRLKRGRQRLRTRLLSRGVGLASALALLGTAFRQAQAASSSAEAATQGHELFRLFDGGAETSSVLSNAQGLYAEEANMIAIGWGKSAAVIGGVALACGGLVGVFWQGSFGPGVAQAQMGGFGGGYGGGGFGGEMAPPPAGPVVTVRLAGNQPPPQEGESPFFSPLSEPPGTLALISDVRPIDFLETPMKDVLDVIEQQALVEMQIDRVALEEVAVTPDAPVTMQSGSMTTADALDAILEPMQLTYVAKERYLLITSRERASQMMETRMYAIADHPLLRTADGNAIVNAITGHVEPDRWYDNGGLGSVSLLPGVLIVTNDQRTLDSVEDFLAQYGKLLARYEPAPQPGMGMGGMIGSEGGYGMGAAGYGAESSGMEGSPYDSGSAPRGVFGAAANPYGVRGGFIGGAGGGGDEAVEEEAEDESAEQGSGEGSSGPSSGDGESGSPFGPPSTGAGSFPGAAPGPGIPGLPGGAVGIPGAGPPVTGSGIGGLPPEGAFGAGISGLPGAVGGALGAGPPSAGGSGASAGAPPATGLPGAIGKSGSKAPATGAPGGLIGSGAGLPGAAGP